MKPLRAVKGNWIMDFQVDERLVADSHGMAQFPLSEVRLMNDARYKWFLLVPRRDALVEFIDLELSDQAQLVSEISFMSIALKSLYAAQKLNVAMLGNMVPQLHVHVIGRNAGDAAWPGPVWGVGDMVAYEENAVAEIRGEISKFITANTVQD